MNRLRVARCILLLIVAVLYGRMVAHGDEAVCPLECLCDLDQFVVNCSGRGLFDVPQQDANESFRWAESMDFGGNLLYEVRAETLRSFGGLLDLSLANNRIGSVSNGSFSLLVGRLQRLVLRGNELVDVPPAIRGLTALRELDLSQNRLWSIGSDSFTGMDRLETLYLDQNNLQVFDGAAFHGLRSLCKLSMTENFLAEDPVGWFANSPLHTLYLSHNAVPLSSEVRSWFGSNDIAPLENLVLINNEIKSLKGKFRGMANLHMLDLGANQIKVVDGESTEGLSNLNELIINANSLEYIDEGSFREMLDLQVLKVDENHLVSLPRGLFSPTKRLANLNAARNDLRDISAVTDEHLGELTKLYLFSNSIEEIASHGFTRLPMLSKLIAGGNRFTHVPNVTNLPWLETLELSQNLMRSVSHSAFRGSTAIREIYLEQNRMEGLDYRPFAELYDLERLSLANNPWFCDCRIEWMQDIVYDEYPPLWVDDIIDGVFCEKPPELKSVRLIEVSQNNLVLRCPTLPDRNVILALLVIWFGFIFLCTGRYWFRKLSKSNKSKSLGRRNSRYQKRMSRKRRNGIIFNPISGLAFGGSESCVLILQNRDNDEQDGGTGGNGKTSGAREEIARVTTV